MNDDHPVILIADANAQDASHLASALRRDNYEVRAFSRGDAALDEANRSPPSLAFVDALTPVIDGFEFCRSLKRDVRLKNIPVVITLGAVAAEADKMRVFHAGAADYASKPLHGPEVLARMRRQLDLSQHVRRLEGVVVEQRQALDEAAREAACWTDARTHWIHMLAHEVRTPLTSIFGTASMLFGRLSKDDELVRMRGDYEAACARIRKLIDDAVALGEAAVRPECSDARPVALRALIDAALEGVAHHPAGIRFRTGNMLPPGVLVLGQRDLLERALGDLLLTAACCVPPGGRVTLRTRMREQAVHIEIRTRGRTLPPAELGTFFELGGQRTLHRGGADFGLGATLARALLQTQGARVTVRNARDEEGLIIDAALPVADIGLATAS